MGSFCTRPVISDTDDVVNRFLSSPVDYPRAAIAFENIGFHEYAVLCWLAAGQPMTAERVYERGGLTIIDNRYGDTPIWCMIIFTRMGDFSKVDEYKSMYLTARTSPLWISQILAAI